MERYSVLMSLYIKDKPEYLRLALQSMIYQTYAPDEIVIVKDGPITDELQAVLDDFENRYPGLFHILGYDKNRGLGLALNYGLKHCRNELVARMDTDDISKPERCEKQMKMFDENSTLEIVGGDIAEFLNTPDKIIAFRRVPTTDKEIKDYMRIRCPFNHVSVMFKRSSVVRSGNYQDLFWNEDYFLWIRMAEHGCQMGNTGTVLVDVRTGANMYKRRGGKKYFESEKFLQKYMLNQEMISKPTYLMNLAKRWTVQVAMPNFLRGFLFKTVARSKK